MREVHRGKTVPLFVVREGRIVADYTKPLPSLSVPEIIQIVVVPTGEYTVELPSESGFVVEVRQHGVILASASTSFSFAVGLFVPYGAQWQQGTALYTAGTLTPVEQGAVFKFSFKADPSSAHALGIAYELANGMQLALNGEVLLDVDAFESFDSFDSFDALNHLVVPASALKEENEVVVTLRANSPQQEFFLFQCSVFPLLSITEMPPRSLYVTNSVNVGVLGVSDA